MLIKETIELLNAYGIISYVGSRNENLVPSHAYAYGISCNEAQTELTVFIEKEFFDLHLNNFKSNGRVSVLVGNPVNHYANQFKGKYLTYAECDAIDKEFAVKELNEFRDVLGQGYGPAMKENMNSIQVNHCIKFTMKIEEVYDQTPGPGAGKLISN